MLAGPLWGSHISVSSSNPFQKVLSLPRLYQIAWGTLLALFLSAESTLAAWDLKISYKTSVTGSNVLLKLGTNGSGFLIEKLIWEEFQ